MQIPAPLMRHQGIICCVAFDRSSLRRIAPYASVVAPRRLTSNTLLAIRNGTKPSNFSLNTQIGPSICATLQGPETCPGHPTASQSKIENRIECDRLAKALRAQ